jgi:hypothetical protein
VRGGGGGGGGCPPPPRAEARVNPFRRGCRPRAGR